MDADGIIYVNAWKDIRARVGGIEPRNDGGADILIRVNERPEVRSVRKYGAYQKADGHSGEQHGAKPVVAFHVCKKKIKDCARHIGEPEHVRNNEVFIKRNKIIEPDVHDVIVACHRLLQIYEPWNIDESIA